MRIAHVVHSYFPRIGGIERAVQHLAEEQVKLGHEVTVITSNVDVVARGACVGNENISVYIL
jgi:glycosyltransferase involved in cell wall biosynthesis